MNKEQVYGDIAGRLQGAFGPLTTLYGLPKEWLIVVREVAIKLIELELHQEKPIRTSWERLSPDILETPGEGLRMQITRVLNTYRGADLIDDVEFDEIVDGLTTALKAK